MTTKTVFLKDQVMTAEKNDGGTSKAYRTSIGTFTVPPGCWFVRYDAIGWYASMPERHFHKLFSEFVETKDPQNDPATCTRPRSAEIAACTACNRTYGCPVCNG
jgi:hypothetical protein